MSSAYACSALRDMIPPGGGRGRFGGGKVPARPPCHQPPGVILYWHCDPTTESVGSRGARSSMTHEEAFLQDIVENRDDDTPRRIFADWLLDQDDPVSLARGEFIHLQCDLAR